MCTNCDSYDKTLYLSEGPHQLEVKATDKAGNSVSEIVNLEIDSKKPRIIKTTPYTNGYTNGSFLVKYTETDITTVKFFYGPNAENEFILIGCPSGTNAECSANLDIS